MVRFNTRRFDEAVRRFGGVSAEEAKRIKRFNDRLKKRGIRPHSVKSSFRKKK